jgi:hypothetical protein
MTNVGTSLKEEAGQNKRNPWWLHVQRPLIVSREPLDQPDLLASPEIEVDAYN